MMEKLASHYSGKLSRKFWKRINALPEDGGHETAYALGVLLQEVEGRVLRLIAGIEERQADSTPVPDSRRDSA